MTRSVLGHGIGDQHVHAFAAARPAHPQADTVEKQVRPAVLQLCLVKLPHSIVQFARQFRDRLRTYRLACKRRHDTTHLARGDAPQKRFANQHSHIFGTSLELLNSLWDEVLFPRPGNTQPYRAQPCDKVPLIKSVAVIGPRFAWNVIVPAGFHVAVPIPQRLRFPELFPCQTRAPVHITPETVLQIRNEMLELFRNPNRCYLRHGCKLLHQVWFSLSGETNLHPLRFYTNNITSPLRHSKPQWSGENACPANCSTPAAGPRFSDVA